MLTKKHSFSTTNLLTYLTLYLYWLTRVLAQRVEKLSVDRVSIDGLNLDYDCVRQSVVLGIFAHPENTVYHLVVAASHCDMDGFASVFTENVNVTSVDSITQLSQQSWQAVVPPGGCHLQRPYLLLQAWPHLRSLDAIALPGNKLAIPFKTHLAQPGACKPVSGTAMLPQSGPIDYRLGLLRYNGVAPLDRRFHESITGIRSDGRFLLLEYYVEHLIKDQGLYESQKAVVTVDNRFTVTTQFDLPPVLSDYCDLGPTAIHQTSEASFHIGYRDSINQGSSIDLITFHRDASEPTTQNILSLAGEHTLLPGIKYYNQTHFVLRTVTLDAEHVNSTVAREKQLRGQVGDTLCGIHYLGLRYLQQGSQYRDISVINTIYLVSYNGKAVTLGSHAGVFEIPQSAIQFDVDNNSPHAWHVAKKAYGVFAAGDILVANVNAITAYSSHGVRQYTLPISKNVTIAQIVGSATGIHLFVKENAASSILTYPAQKVVPGYSTTIKPAEMSGPVARQSATSIMPKTRQPQRTYTNSKAADAVTALGLLAATISAGFFVCGQCVKHRRLHASESLQDHLLPFSHR